MNKIWVIARREFLATVRTKAFVIGVVMMPVLMLLGGVISTITRKLDDQGERTFAVIDRTPGMQVFPLLEEAAKKRNDNDILDPKTRQRIAPAFKLESVAPAEDVDGQRLAQSARVRKGEITGFLEIGPEAMSKAGRKPHADPLNDPAATRYQSMVGSPGAAEFHRWAEPKVSAATLGPEAWKAMQEQRPAIIPLGLSSLDPVTGKATDDAGGAKAIARILVGVGCIMLMFVIIFVVATPLMQGVLEEKMQRISEVLLGSVTPFTLMAGKLLGGVGVALVLAAVYVGGAYAGLWYYGQASQVPPWLIGWFLFYLVLALFMYGSLFMAVGAACTDMKESQTLILPVMLPAMLPLFLLAPILTSPDGMLARWASFFPPCTPMLMIARLSLSANIAWWEPVLGSALVLAFTVFCVWIAGRIFRVGILVQGKGATFGEMAGWVFRG